MPDYTTTKIYRIVCDETGDQYIGSTTRSLSARLASHVAQWKYWKKNEKNEATRTSFFTSFPLLERGKYRILLVENYPCASKEEKVARENYWMDNIEGGCVNKVRPARTKEQYREEHKEEMKEYQKVYWRENREELAAKKKEYRKQNEQQIKERKKRYYDANREKLINYQKQYAQEHETEKKEYKKQYREKNQDKIRQHAQLEYDCECGAKIRRVEKARHNRSKKHQEYSRGVLNSQTPVANTTPST